MLEPSARLWAKATWLWLLGVAVLIGLTFRDYGITWDEELQSQYGLAVVDYYLSLFQDHRFEQIFNLYLYGGMFDGLASIFDRFTPFSLYETRHFVNGLFGLLGLWGAARLGRFLGGPRVGFMALAMLSLTPMFYGHMFNNPKDIPFAAGIVWSIYYMGRINAAHGKASRRYLVKLGVILGLTLGVRVGGAMLPAYWVILSLARPSTWTKDGFKNLLLKRWLPVGAVTYGVMLLCWPWAQQSPIANPLRALGEFSNFPQDVEVLLDGVSYRSTQLPWSYVPLYFGIQLPEFLLALLAASVAIVPMMWSSLDQARRQTLGLMLLMALAPITYAVVRHPALYDAVRHFLFVVVIACVVAALTGCWLWQRLRNAVGTPRYAMMVDALALALSVMVIATQAWQMAQLHPYEYIYANRFAGGVAGIYGRYELDYWGSSFKEAAQKLQAFVAAEGGVPPGKIYKVAICGPWSAAMIYLPPDYEPVVANEPAEFFLSTTRWLCPKMRPGKDIIEVSRMGAPLAVVKDLRGGFEYYEGNTKLIK